MIRHDHTQWDIRYGTAQTGTSMDALIRPCIRQAFPLPADDSPGDERFRLLLDALTHRGSGTD